MALFSPQSEKKPSLHTALVGHGVFSVAGSYIVLVGCPTGLIGFC